MGDVFLEDVNVCGCVASYAEGGYYAFVNFQLFYLIGRSKWVKGVRVFLEDVEFRGWICIYLSSFDDDQQLDFVGVS